MSRRLGACAQPDGSCRFLVWAPAVARVEIELVAPRSGRFAMHRDASGHHEATVAGVRPGDRYLLVLDGDRRRPDPASRFQPEGVHGPSQVVGDDFAWSDGGWRGVPLEDLVTYELHVGTFTDEGTFEAVIPHLAELRELGVTAVELMPIAQFPGGRNWGYDGVLPFAVQSTYGGPDGLRRLVDACHGHGLAVLVDVVYNHLGPEGNYLADFGPYFTGRHVTPWGAAINFDDRGCDHVREHFVQSARQWIRDYHADGLRVDAVHAIVDTSAHPFLLELAEAVRDEGRQAGRHVHVIAESALNDHRVVAPWERGGLAQSACWNDDFHHALHALLTGERAGYYQDFGRVSHLARAFAQGFAYQGEHSAFRGRRHGNSARDVRPDQLVVFAQDHDQVGNRPLGDRLSTLVPFEALKLAAAAVILSPWLPLLFMGEEHGETAPFLYFTSHGDAELREAVRRGRTEEVRSFGWDADAPDPGDEATFARSRLDRGLRETPRGRALLELHRDLLELRRRLETLARPVKSEIEAEALEPQRTLLVRRGQGEHALVQVACFADEPSPVPLPPLEGRRWRTLLDTADARFLGPGAAAHGGTHEITPRPWSFLMLGR